MKKTLSIIAASMAISFSQAHSAPENYKIDTSGAHASINFKVQHLGYSFLTGRFDNFDGSFIYDNKSPKDSSISITINTKSVNSNHQKRDDHLRSKDFLFSEKFPTATFISTSYTPKNDISGTLTGTLTLRGISKEIDISVTKIGEGNDPWGGYRAGFEGNTSIQLKEFGIPKNLGPKSDTIQLNLQIEGIKQSK